MVAIVVPPTDLLLLLLSYGIVGKPLMRVVSWR
jgi:hypothetical protein